MCVCAYVCVSQCVCACVCAGRSSSNPLSGTEPGWRKGVGMLCLTVGAGTGPLLPRAWGRTSGCAGSLPRHGPLSSRRERRPLSRVREGVSLQHLVQPGSLGSGAPGLRAQAQDCGARAYLLLGRWDLPRPEIEAASPALAGRVFTAEPSGRPGYVV